MFLPVLARFGATVAVGTSVIDKNSGAMPTTLPPMLPHRLTAVTLMRRSGIQFCTIKMFEVAAVITSHCWPW